MDGRDNPVRTPLTGCADELRQLHRCWQRAQGGAGNVVLITGEPGIGKSRLAGEVIRSIGEGSATIARLHCSEHAVNSELQLIQRFLTGTADQDRGEAARWQSKIRDVHPSTAGLPTPPQRREAVLRALSDIASEITAASPLLLVIEDAHWLDPTSAALLDRLVGLCPSQRLLIIVTARRPFDPSWLHSPHVSVILPRRLGAADTSAMVDAIAGPNAFSASGHAYVVARSEGVPLFIEQLARAHPSVVDAQSPSETLQNLLADRIARLNHLKGTAQVLSALGPTFSHHHAMLTLGTADAEGAELIKGLMADDILRMQPVKPDAQYLFRHALLHEAAYESVPVLERAALHTRIAGVLERDGKSRLRPEILAHHYDRAEMYLQAAQNWLAAGRRSAEHGAIDEAINCLKLGLQSAGRAPEGSDRDRVEFELNLHLGPALMARFTYASDEALKSFTRAQSLLRHSQSSLEDLHVLLGRFNVHFGRGELAQSLEVAKIADRALSIGYGGYPVLMGQALCMMGQFLEARDCLQRALALYNPSIDIDSGLFCRADVVATSFLAKVEFTLGNIDRSSSLTLAAMSLAQQQGHPVALAIAYLGQVLLEVEFGNFDNAAAIADEALCHVSQHKLDNYRHWIAFHRAALLLRSDPMKAASSMHDAVTDAEAAGSRLFRPTQLGLLSVAYASTGRTERALRLVDEGVRIAHLSGELEAVPALHRLRARAVSTVNQQEAIQELTTSLAIARSQSSRIEELRSATALARALKGSYRQDEARETLANAFAQFAGRRPFPDLKQAARVLTSLEATKWM